MGACCASEDRKDPGNKKKKAVVLVDNKDWLVKEVESLGEGTKSFSVESGQKIKFKVSSYGATLLSVKCKSKE